MINMAVISLKDIIKYLKELERYKDAEQQGKIKTIPERNEKK